MSVQTLYRLKTVLVLIQNCKKTFTVAFNHPTTVVKQAHTWSLLAKISRSNATWPRLDGPLCLSLLRTADQMHIANFAIQKPAVCIK